MTPHLPAILAALALLYVPLLCVWVLWRRWQERPRPERLKNAHYIAYGMAAAEPRSGLR